MSLRAVSSSWCRRRAPIPSALLRKRADLATKRRFRRAHTGFVSTLACHERDDLSVKELTRIGKMESSLGLSIGIPAAMKRRDPSAHPVLVRISTIGSRSRRATSTVAALLPVIDPSRKMMLTLPRRRARRHYLCAFNLTARFDIFARFQLGYIISELISPMPVSPSADVEHRRSLSPRDLRLPLNDFHAEAQARIASPQGRVLSNNAETRRSGSAGTGGAPAAVPQAPRLRARAWPSHPAVGEQQIEQTLHRRAPVREIDSDSRSLPIASPILRTADPMQRRYSRLQ